MPRSIDESVSGSDLTIPDANDFFSVESGGMPDGSDCLVINAGAVSSPDVRAYVPAPVLSPNFMHQAGQAFSLTFWAKSNGVAGGGNFFMGVQNSSAPATGVETNHPIRIVMSTPNNNGFGSMDCTVYSGSVTNTSTTVSLSGTPAPNTWIFNAFMFGSPGNPCYGFRSYAASVPPVNLAAGANRAAGTAAYASGQHFYIGRYSNTSAPITTGVRVLKLGKIAFHDHVLSLTECKMLFDAMVNY